MYFLLLQEKSWMILLHTEIVAQGIEQFLRKHIECQQFGHTESPGRPNLLPQSLEQRISY